jgi:hypothetical protein
MMAGIEPATETLEAAMDGAHFDDVTKVMMGGRRRVLTMAAALALGGALRTMVSPEVAQAAKRKRAYQCVGPPELTIFPGGDTRQGQRFTATRSGSLRQIKVAIHKAASSSAGDSVVQLVKVTGSPNGTPSSSPLDVLAAVTIPDATVPYGASTLTAKFAGTILEQGKEYAAVISRPGSDSLGVGIWDEPGGNACAGQMVSARVTARSGLPPSSTWW